MKNLALLATLALPLFASAQTLNDAMKQSRLIQADVVHKLLSHRGQVIKGQNTVIAVLDSGINALHPDILGKLARNNTEIAANGIDDDANGFVDDYDGWNFFTNNSNTFDDNGHGTHVASTIVANDYGIAPLAHVVPVKVTINPKGNISDDNLIAAIRYAVDNGAKIINLSLGGIYADMPVTAYVISEAVKYAAKNDVLVIAAAGNNALDISKEPVLPATVESPYLLTICAVDDNGGLASFSNYSATKVDFCAPGVNIAAANSKYYRFGNHGSQYSFLSGTSMATPIVTGVAAMLRGMEPGMSAPEIKKILMKVAKKRAPLTPWLRGTSRTGGTINAIDAVRELKKQVGVLF